jgi:hypothetical protein
MAEPADRIPPVQKTFNYYKPATSGYTQRASGAMAAPARRTLNSTPKAESREDFMQRLTKEADDYRDIIFERDAPASEYADMSLSEFLPRVARGVLPSGAEMAYDVGNAAVNAVKDPIGTGKAVLGGLGSLAMGLGSKISDSARSAMGLEVNPFESGRKQQALDDLIFNAKRRYGLGEPGSFWKNLADDPASYIADAAAVVTGGASAAKKVANIANTRQLRRIADETRQGLINLQTGNFPPSIAEARRAAEDIAFDDELNRIFGPPTPNDPFPEDIANAAALRNRQDLADNEVDGGFFHQQPIRNRGYLPYVDDNPLDDPAFRPDRYLDDVFPSILERAQRRDPLTDQEAFDVMTFERHGLDGVYDPTNTFENWGQQTNNDREGAERIAYLTGADRHAGQNPVAPVEGPYFADGYEADADTPDYDYGYGYDDPAYDEELNQFDTFSYGPLVQSEEGIASMYSPTRRAVEQLRQSTFPDPVSMEKQLLAMGAKPDELESLLKRIGKSDVSEGGLKKLRLAELADEAATEVQQFRRPDREYDGFHLTGATDPHVTTFEAPVGETPKGVNQHFGARIPGNAVLAHIRSAMFSTPGANRPNVYHLGEIQSDWAQFRVKLLPTDDDLISELSVYNEYLTDFEEARGMGTIFDFDYDMAKMGERIALTRKYGTREEFDRSNPAPYVKTTRKWHQLALKQALIEAVNSGAEYMSLATGKQAKSYTGGTLEGQQKFYDEMTPRELDNILTKFSKETGVEKPVLEYQFIYGQDGSGHEVPAIRITDEFREAMKKYGLPSFAKGGIVTLPI